MSSFRPEEGAPPCFRVTFEASPVQTEIVLAFMRECMSVTRTSRLLRILGRKREFEHLGTWSEERVVTLLRTVIAISLQHIKDALRNQWAFALGLEQGVQAASSSPPLPPPPPPPSPPSPPPLIASRPVEPKLNSSAVVAAAAAAAAPRRLPSLDRYQQRPGVHRPSRSLRKPGHAPRPARGRGHVFGRALKLVHIREDWSPCQRGGARVVEPTHRSVCHIDVGATGRGGPRGAAAG